MSEVFVFTFQDVRKTAIIAITQTCEESIMGLHLKIIFRSY